MVMASQRVTAKKSERPRRALSGLSLLLLLMLHLQRPGNGVFSVVSGLAPRTSTQWKHQGTGGALSWSRRPAGSTRTNVLQPWPITANGGLRSGDHHSVKRTLRVCCRTYHSALNAAAIDDDDGDNDTLSEPSVSTRSNARQSSRVRRVPPTLSDDSLPNFDYQLDADDLEEMARQEMVAHDIVELDFDADPTNYMADDEMGNGDRSRDRKRNYNDESRVPVPPAPTEGASIRELLDDDPIHRGSSQSNAPAASPRSYNSKYSPRRDDGTTHFNEYVHAYEVGSNDEPLNNYVKRAAYGNGATTNFDAMRQDLDALQQRIYQQNNNKIFNVNSPAQVSRVLFGTTSGESTNKDVLERMAGAGNRMAALVLEYRRLAAQIKREERKALARSNARQVDATPQRSHDDRSNTVAPAPADAKDPLMLVDASAYIFRAYYSMPPIHRSDGMPTGAVLGFCNMLNRLVLNRLLAGDNPRLVLVFDAKGKTFRHQLFPDYKGNRPDAPMDLLPQFGLIRQAAHAYGLCQLEAPTYEADDVIATLVTMAQQENLDTQILSGDKDLWQLVRDGDNTNATSSTTMLDPMTLERVTEKDVVAKWGVPPTQLGDVLALAGDAADNVPGVPGIGPKIAAQLLQEYGSLDTLLDQVDAVPQKGRRDKLRSHLDQARLSRQLVDLVRNVPAELLTFPDNVDRVSDLRAQDLDGDRLLAFYDEMGFRDARQRVQSRLLQTKYRRNKSRYNRRPKAEVPEPEDYADVPF